MYEIYFSAGLSRLLLGKAGDESQAKFMARKWSASSTQDVHVRQEGQVGPIWVFRNGVEAGTGQ